MRSKIEWISHRGVRVNAAENTFLAFSEAKKRGFRRLETDLRTTLDGDLVCSHDRTLERLAGIAKEVSAMKRSELETIKLPAGGKLFFFDELIQNFYADKWLFDVKPESSEQVVTSLMRWAKKKPGHRQWLEENVDYLFWNQADEDAFLKLVPKARVYAKFTDCLKAGLALVARVPLSLVVKPGRIYSLSPDFKGLKFFKPEFVERFHKEGLKVLAFLPKNRAEVQLAFNCGFDQILVDEDFGFKVT